MDVLQRAEYETSNFYGISKETSVAMVNEIIRLRAELAEAKNKSLELVSDMLVNLTSKVNLSESDDYDQGWCAGLNEAIEKILELKKKWPPDFHQSEARNNGLEAAALWHDAEAARYPAHWKRKIAMHQISAAAIRAIKGAML